MAHVEPQLLNYGTRREMRWRMYILVGISLLMGGYFLYRFTALVCRHVVVLIDQHRCLNYVPATGEIAASGAEPKVNLIGPPSCFIPLNDELASAAPSPFVPSHSIWTDSSACVFLGGLRNSKGTRLVIVTLGWAGDMSIPITGPGQDYDSELRLSGWVLQPASLTQPPRVLNCDGFPSKFSKSYAKGYTSATIYVGRKDPSDPSRITINYLYDGHPAVIAGKLGDDDHLHFTQISGPGIILWNAQIGHSPIRNPR